MKKSILISLALLILFIGISSVWANESYRTLAQSTEEIMLRGIAIEYFGSIMPGSPWGWTVEVEEVLSGPPISGQVDIGMQAFLPWGYMDPTIEEGDEVKAFGLFCPFGPPCDYISLNGEDYYITTRWYDVYLPLIVRNG